MRNHATHRNTSTPPHRPISNSPKPLSPKTQLTINSEGNVATEKFSIAATSDVLSGGSLTLTVRPGFKPCKYLFPVPFTGWMGW
jgi:hypothetical protein